MLAGILIHWYRIVTIATVTWLAAAGPMPAFAMSPAPSAVDGAELMWFLLAACPGTGASS